MSRRHMVTEGSSSLQRVMVPFLRAVSGCSRTEVECSFLLYERVKRTLARHRNRSV
jgi:hypothetical protein